MLNNDNYKCSEYCENAVPTWVRIGANFTDPNYIGTQDEVNANPDEFRRPKSCFSKWSSVQDAINAGCKNLPTESNPLVKPTGDCLSISGCTNGSFPDQLQNCTENICGMTQSISTSTKCGKTNGQCFSSCDVCREKSVLSRQNYETMCVGCYGSDSPKPDKKNNFLLIILIVGGLILTSFLVYIILNKQTSKPLQNYKPF